MQPWQTLSRQLVLDRGKFLRVEDHTVELPDGRVIEQWPWIITPDYINVFVLTDDNQLVCFRQGKYAIDGESFALVGGYVEPGEEPLVAAQRELLEETGYAARDWIELGHYRVDANRGAGTAHFYMARGAHRIADRNADDLEEQALQLLGRDEVEAALRAGEFKLLAWTALAALALLYWKG